MNHEESWLALRRTAMAIESPPEIAIIVTTDGPPFGEVEISYYGPPQVGSYSGKDVTVWNDPSWGALEAMVQSARTYGWDVNSITAGKPVDEPDGRTLRSWELDLTHIGSEWRGQVA